jgi:hypothetical protein
MHIELPFISVNGYVFVGQLRNDPIELLRLKITV